MAKGGRIRIYPEVFRRILDEYFEGTVEELVEVVGYKDFGKTKEERKEFFHKLLIEGGTLSVDQVEKLSRKIGIAVLAFYLSAPKVIPSRKRRKDNRTGVGELSYKDRMWLRNAEIVQQILEEILGERWEINLPVESDAVGDLSGSRLAENLRNILDFSPGRWSDYFEIFRILRDKIESLGIPVLRLPIDAKNVRGSVIHGRVPLIIVSSGDFPAAQSFTLIHELCHIIQRDAGEDVMELCSEYAESRKNSREAFCNRVAGKFLLPNSIVEEEFERWEGTIEDFAESIARKYGVSRGVVYNRLIESHLISGEEYERYMEENARREWKLYYRGRPGKSDYGRIILNRYGKFTLSRLIEAYTENRLDSSLLVHVLKLGRDDRIADVEAVLYSWV